MKRGKWYVSRDGWVRVKDARKKYIATSLASISIATCDKYAQSLRLLVTFTQSYPVQPRSLSRKLTGIHMPTYQQPESHTSTHTPWFAHSSCTKWCKDKQHTHRHGQSCFHIWAATGPGFYLVHRQMQHSRKIGKKLLERENWQKSTLPQPHPSLHGYHHVSSATNITVQLCTLTT